MGGGEIWSWELGASTMGTLEYQEREGEVREKLDMTVGASMNNG